MLGLALAETRLGWSTVLSRSSVLLVLGLALTVAVLLWLRVPGMNGSRFWDWPWRWLPILAVYPVMLAAATPLFLALKLHHSRRCSAGLALVLVTVSALALELGARRLQARSNRFDGTAAIVFNPAMTSYFTDARRLVGQEDLLATFTREMPRLGHHSRTHPPGPVAFYVALLSLFDSPRAAALAGAGLIALLAALGVPATFWMCRALDCAPDAALYAASCMALAPSVLLFFPSFDPVYPIFTAAILGSWALALRTAHWKWAVACGVALAAGLFFAYNLLVLGAFFVVLSFFVVVRDGASALRTGTVQAWLTLLTLIGVYLACWLLTGFNAFETFRIALINQQQLSAGYDRPWPDTVPSDLVDFVRGAGWAPALLAVFCLVDRLKRGVRQDPLGWIVVACLAQILVTALSGLLRVETARVWIFLMPLLMLPAGIELASWRPADRAVAFGAIWLLLACSHQTVSFFQG